MAHASGPGCQEEGKHGHGERAPLRDATGVAMWNTQPACNSVVIDHLAMKALVCLEDVPGETSQGQEQE